jgi:hypothetical protein
MPKDTLTTRIRKACVGIAKAFSNYNNSQYTYDEKDSFFSAFILGRRGVCHMAVPLDLCAVVRIAEQEMD